MTRTLFGLRLNWWLAKMSDRKWTLHIHLYNWR